MVDAYLNGVRVPTLLSDAEVLNKLEGEYGSKIMNHIRVGIEQGAFGVDEVALRDLAEELLSNIAGEFYISMKHRDSTDDDINLGLEF